MAFPADPLTVVGELALDADLTADPGTWAFTTITSYLYTRDAIQISRGRADQASLADTSRLGVTADNRDGRWSTRNPNGAWYGQLRKGTPIRISAEGHVRYTGFLSELPPRWDLSGRDRYAPLTAQGRLYQLTQGASPARSATRRTVGASSPVAYWPCEDGSGATQLAAAVGSNAAALQGDVFPGSMTGPVGTEPVCDFSVGTGSFVANVPPFESTGFWSITFTVAGTMSTSPHPTQAMLVIDTTGGTTSRYYVLIYAGWSGGAFTSTHGIDLLGILTTAFNAPDANPYDLDMHEVHIRFTQNGANIDYELWWDGVQAYTASAAGTLGVPTTISGPATSAGFLDGITIDNTGAAVAIGHLSIHSDPATADGFFDAMTGYDGEEAAVRFLRLSVEEGIPAECAATLSQAMGPQLVDSYLPLARQCEATDQGYLYENLDFGLTLQGHQERENLDPALELDYEESGHVSPPLEPTDDDREARNDVQVKRDGGSATQVVEDDPGVELSIPNIGRRDESITYSLQLDSQTAQLAPWRLHKGTWPGYRFPSLTVNLAAGPTLIADVCNAGLAYRVTVDNPPDDIGPDLVDLAVEGYSETLEKFGWLVQNNCSLYGPWHVGELATTTSDANEWAGRLAGDAEAAIRIAIDTDDTSIQFDPNRYRWTTVADDFDPDLRVRFGGETADVSTIATTAGTYVAAGALSHADNAAVTPALYAGATARDLICVLARIRSTSAGTLTTPAGYTRLPIAGLSATAKMQLFVKVHSGSESNPTMTPSGGSAGDTVSAVTFGLRGTPSTLDDLADIVVASLGQVNASAQNIAYPGVYPRYQEGCIVLALGGKDDDWTSVAALSGFTEAVDGSTTTGNDQGLVVDYLIQTTPAVVNEGSFVVTGGASAPSHGAVIAIAAGYQTMTVSARSVNGIVKSHAAGTRVEVDNPFIPAL